MPAIVPRAAWGARPPKSPPERIPTPTPELWIHHFGTEQHGAEGMRAIQTYHMDTKGWNDFAYSFAVDDDGAVYEGRGFGIAGGHTKGRNTVSHAIVFMGNLDARQPTEAAMASARWLIQEGIRQGAWRGVTGGHRDAPGARTACPGRYLYARIGELVAAPTPTQPATPTNEDEDMAQIIWYKDAAGKAHAYQVFPASGLGKYLTPDGYNLTKFLKVAESNTAATAFDAIWQGTVVLVDGPLANLPRAAVTAASGPSTPADIASEFAKRLAA